MIKINVKNRDGNQKVIEIPEDINLSLMEILKVYEYDIEATCGGIALCATCHISVIKGANKLLPPGDAELDMLDTLPNATDNSRLACQIRVNNYLEGLEIELK